MNVVAISEFRTKLAKNLEKVKTTKKPLIFGSRHKREFIILPYPNLETDENLFEIYDDLEDKMIQLDYYKWVENNFSDWNDDENENLFE